jgi:hypothetical protein
MPDSDFVHALRQNGFPVAPGTAIEPPSVLVHFGKSPGDDLLCTTIFRELARRGIGPAWMMTYFPELFANNSDVSAIVPRDAALVTTVEQVGGRFVLPVYTSHDWKEDLGDPVPAMHILAVMCEMTGITGDISLRPYLHLTERETLFGRFSPRQIAIQTSGASAMFPMKNKEWLPERFQQVVNTLIPEFTIVQIGSASDPPLVGAIDLRGKTTIRQSAAILKQSEIFIGLVGFLMHLARAVDTRSVIVYGGRELPSQTGYTCNENITSILPCSPCWQWNRCAFEHSCMTGIQSGAVINAVRRQLARMGEPILDDVGTIAKTPATADEH